jgi:acetolactate synthase I/II/III large subunit
VNLSCHLAEFVRDELGCKTAFSLTGGGAMFLNDAFGNTSGLTCVYNHHEQGSAMAAVGYAKLAGIGVCVTTTGCGSTNAVTGLLDAYQDSVPVLFISGQVKRRETTRLSGLPLRGFGVQELDILPVVSSISKKTYFIDSLSTYFEVLGKLKTDLLSGRPGPVWVDIPLDLQSSSVESMLTRLGVPTDTVGIEAGLVRTPIDPLVRELELSNRPVFIVGNGLRLSQGGSGIEELKEISQRYSIPIVSTYLGNDFFRRDFENYFGVAGLKAARRANIILHNADLIIALGCRLATSVIGYEYEKFAPEAKIFAVDVDQSEHQKPTTARIEIVADDCFSFLNRLRANISAIDHIEWLESCKQLSALLPVREQVRMQSKVSIYDVVEQVCELAGDHDCVVSDAGSAYYVASMLFTKRTYQRYVTSGAQADMGFSIPAAIGAAFSGLTSRIHAITGDGSALCNIQEVQTIVHYKLPITIYVLNNNGYLSIRSTQKNFFPKRQCGTDRSNGVSFPSFEALASAFGVEYVKAETVTGLKNAVRMTQNLSYPALVEVMCPTEEEIIPRTQTKRSEDGSLISEPLSSMYPELPKEMIQKIEALAFRLK